MNTPRQPRTAVSTFYGISLGVACLFFTVSNGLAVWRITNHHDPLFAVTFAVVLTGGAYSTGHLSRGRWATDWAPWLMSLALIGCLAWLGIAGGAWHSEHLGVNAWGAGITLAVWGAMAPMIAFMDGWEDAGKALQKAEAPSA